MYICVTKTQTHTFLHIYLTHSLNIYFPYLPVCHYLFLCVTWLIHMCDMTHSIDASSSHRCVCGMFAACRFTNKNCVGLRDITQSYARNDSFGWLIYLMLLLLGMCLRHTDPRRALVLQHVAFLRVTWLIHTCDMTHLLDASSFSGVSAAYAFTNTTSLAYGGLYRETEREREREREIKIQNNKRMI